MLSTYARTEKLKMVWEKSSLSYSFLSADPYNSALGYLQQLSTRGAKQ